MKILRSVCYRKNTPRRSVDMSSSDSRLAKKSQLQRRRLLIMHALCYLMYIYQSRNIAYKYLRIIFAYIEKLLEKLLQAYTYNFDNKNNFIFMIVCLHNSVARVPVCIQERLLLRQHNIVAIKMTTFFVLVSIFMYKSFQYFSSGFSLFCSPFYVSFAFSGGNLKRLELQFLHLFVYPDFSYRYTSMCISFQYLALRSSMWQAYSVHFVIQRSHFQISTTSDRPCNVKIINSDQSLILQARQSRELGKLLF